MPKRQYVVIMRCVPCDAEGASVLPAGAAFETFEDLRAHLWSDAEHRPRFRAEHDGHAIEVTLIEQRVYVVAGFLFWILVLSHRIEAAQF